jgi:hypothetical protein
MKERRIIRPRHARAGLGKDQQQDGSGETDKTHLKIPQATV